jgi:hypothetical protein
MIRNIGQRAFRCPNPVALFPARSISVTASKSSEITKTAMAVSTCCSIVLPITIKHPFFYYGPVQLPGVVWVVLSAESGIITHDQGWLVPALTQAALVHHPANPGGLSYTATGYQTGGDIQFGAVFHSHSVPLKLQLNPAEPLRLFTSVEACPKNGSGGVPPLPPKAPIAEQLAIPLQVIPQLGSLGSPKKGSQYDPYSVTGRLKLVAGAPDAELVAPAVP